MNDLSTFATKHLPDRGREWSDSERETAFEVWLSLGRPSLLSVVNILASDTYDLPIPYQTVRRWHTQHQWDLEADRRIAQLAPNLTVRSAAHVVSAGTKAAAYVDQVWSGVLPFEKDRMLAALQTLDRAGFGANVKERPRAELPSMTGDTLDPVDPGELTKDQLIERERLRRQSRARSD
jgi:hypothetical protein